MRLELTQFLLVETQVKTYWKIGYKYKRETGRVLKLNRQIRERAALLLKKGYDDREPEEFLLNDRKQVLSLLENIQVMEVREIELMRVFNGKILVATPATSCVFQADQDATFGDAEPNPAQNIHSGLVIYIAGDYDTLDIAEGLARHLLKKKTPLDILIMKYV